MARRQTKRRTREDRRERFGLGIAKVLAACVLVLVLGLLLDGFGVDAGGYLVLAGLVIAVIEIYVAPLVAPRK